jgi:hypothetical protein
MFALDFMGDFAYSGVFNTMRAGADTDHIRENMEQAIVMGEAIGTIPWIRALVLKLSMQKSRVALESSLAVAETRMAQGASARDLFCYLVCVSSPVCAAPADSATAQRRRGRGSPANVNIHPSHGEHARDHSWI